MGEETRLPSVLWGMRVASDLGVSLLDRIIARKGEKLPPVLRILMRFYLAASSGRWLRAPVLQAWVLGEAPMAG